MKNLMCFIVSVLLSCAIIALFNMLFEAAILFIKIKDIYLPWAYFLILILINMSVTIFILLKSSKTWDKIKLFQQIQTK